jgi:hypothetical protein
VFEKRLKSFQILTDRGFFKPQANKLSQDSFRNQSNFVSRSASPNGKAKNISFPSFLSHNQAPSSEKPRLKSYANLICFNCEELGHTHFDCRKPKDQERIERNKKNLIIMRKKPLSNLENSLSFLKNCFAKVNTKINEQILFRFATPFFLINLEFFQVAFYVCAICVEFLEVD